MKKVLVLGAVMMAAASSLAGNALNANLAIAQKNGDPAYMRNVKGEQVSGSQDNPIKITGYVVDLGEVANSSRSAPALANTFLTAYQEGTLAIFAKDNSGGWGTLVDGTYTTLGTAYSFEKDLTGKYIPSQSVIFDTILEEGHGYMMVLATDNNEVFGDGTDKDYLYVTMVNRAMESTITKMGEGDKIGALHFRLGENMNKGVNDISADIGAANALVYETQGSGGQFLTGGNIVVGTPEPTSAMMLLIGLAGLALKRKRA